MTATEQTLSFEAEVARLLDIVAHALYSNKEIFLRELISNASDACDRLRYAALTQPELLEGGTDLQVRLVPDAKARQLAVIDNGIGMNREDLISHLGTIARSGTSQFLSQLSGDAKKDVSLIGQFGVGFYSAFMVSDKVEVHSRRAGESMGWLWTSDGKGRYTVAEAPEAERGTRIVLHLKEDAVEFLEPARIRRIVKTYSDHIGLPIRLEETAKEAETINAASALWTRPKSEVAAEQYQEFYHHVARAFDEPWATLHYKAEGAIEYAALLFVPKTKPFDLFTPERKGHVRLYVRRVFITDDCAELLPPYLRFLRGVVDSQDLPLNVSREMLQHNAVLAKIKSGLVKRVLAELKKKAEDAPEEYLAFWSEFGPVLKEGIYEDFERREELMELCRFASTVSDAPITLAQYLEKMREGQDGIYYLAGDDPDALRKSPQLEGFAAKGVPVLLLTDPVDEFWVPGVGQYKEKRFRSVAQAGADLGKIAGAEPAEKKPAAVGAELDGLIAAVKLALGEVIKDVRASDRLIESAVCLVADEGDMSLHLERMLRQHRQLDAAGAKRILEINPTHPLIRRLAEMAGKNGSDPVIADAARLLLDQARIVEGEPVSDGAAFARRLAAFVERGLMA